tara:strand:- start:134 stop:469 length:336 start_codon:yes stop_codon:yes gene_type:complete
MLSKENNMRILGNQPEQSLTMSGMTISDFEMRTKSEVTFQLGKQIITDYINANPILDGCQFDIDDPMTVGILPHLAEAGEFDFDDLVIKLEKIGFYGKGAGYYTPQQMFDF